MKFTAPLAVLLSTVAAAWAQVTINTPVAPITCFNQQVTFSGGTAPFTIQVVRYGDPNSVLNTFTGISGSPYTWLVTQGPGESVYLRLRDAGGASNESGRIDIAAGGPYPCASGTAPGGSSSTPVTPPPASSGPAQSSAPPTGSTPTTPAPGGSSGAATTSRTVGGASTSATPNGAVSFKAAGGAVVGFAGLVAAVLA